MSDTNIDPEQAKAVDDASSPAPSANGSSRRVTLERQTSFTMEYYLETANLDDNTVALLRKYDKDGNGVFSKDEVVAVICDLREAINHNTSLIQDNAVFRRLLIAACIFCVLLLSSMFGLSYAVAALTAKTTVNSDNVLVVASHYGENPGNGDRVVSTNSRAEHHTVVQDPDTGVLCSTPEEVTAMLLEVSAGRNVLLEIDSGRDYSASESDAIGGSSTLMQLSGAGVIIDDDAGAYCFIRPMDGQKMCYVPDSRCTGSNTSGRRLSESEHHELIASYGHHHSHGIGRSLSMSRRRLQQTTDDKKADTGGLNLVTGLYYCYAQNEWKVGVTCAVETECTSVYGNSAKCKLYT